MFRISALHIVVCSVILALPAPMALAQDKPLRDVIDAELSAAWQKEKVTPAGTSTDAEFLRRIYLDLAGSIPALEETKAFLADTSPDKREKLIDKLLADPRFAQQQADLWDNVLFGRNPIGDAGKRDGFQAWLRTQFEKNTPYDAWVRAILRADGNSVDGGALYHVQYRNRPEDASEAISQTFLGVQLQCARCHDHPYEEWTQLDFYGMAAFLARLEVVTVGKKDQATIYMIGEKASGDIQFTGSAKEQQPGKKGEPVKPKFLAGDALAEPALPEGFKEVKFEANKPPQAPPYSRKDQLADWITASDNPYFAKAAANRVWSQYMGRGIVHPVDNMSDSNPPSHPELLKALAAGLVDHKFDLKWLVREIVSTRAYQLTSIGATGEAMPIWFQHARMRPLSAEELAEAWRISTGWSASDSAKSDKSASRFRPLTADYVLRYFGTPNNGTGDFQGGLHEQLYLNNGQLGQVIAAKGGLAESLADEKSPLDERIERLFLTTLQRPPTADERTAFAAATEAKMSTQDIVWALITSSEFRFNH